MPHFNRNQMDKILKLLKIDHQNYNFLLDLYNNQFLKFIINILKVHKRF